MEGGGIDKGVEYLYIKIWKKSRKGLVEESAGGKKTIRIEQRGGRNWGRGKRGREHGKRESGETHVGR
jgi:hypothetical protein